MNSLLFYKIDLCYNVYGDNMDNTSNENFSVKIFEKASIPKAVGIMIIPAIISQLILSIYNIADTWYVGIVGNPALIAAISISSPLFHMMTACSNLFGVGGASIIASYLGSGNKKSAKRTFKASIIGSLCVAILYAIIILFFSKNLLMMIGCDATNINYAIIYTLIAIAFGSIPTIMSSTLSHLIRSVGRSKIASFGTVMGLVFNMIIDPILMFVILPPGYEILGTAIGTLLSNILTLIFFIIYLKKFYNEDVLVLDNIDCNKNDFKDIIKRGLTSFTLVGASMLSNCFLNSMISSISQSTAMAGLGITRKIDSVAYAINQGVIQGILPIISYCYSAQKFERMKKVITFSSVCTIIFSIIWFTISYNYAPNLIGLFIKDQETMYYGAYFLRVLCIAVAIYPLSFIIITVFQAVGKTKEAFTLSLMHKGLIDIVLFFVIRKLYGTINIVWASPIVDVALLLIAICMCIRFIKQITKKK